MKISIRALRKIIHEALLIEYAVGPGATLYHRSSKKFKVGDVLSAQTDPATNKSWLAPRAYEQQLERYRQKHTPNLPSRMHCVYASFNPRSRFLNKGYLYAIKPVGQTHVTNSKFIDAISNDSSYSEFPDESLIQSYWEGTEPRRGNINDMEILMDSAEIIEVVDEEKRLQRGMKFTIGSGGPTFKIHENLRSYPNPFFTSDGNHYLSVEDTIDLANTTSGLKVDIVDKDIFVEIGPGFSGFIPRYDSQEPGKNSYPTIPRISIATGDAIVENEGISFILDSNDAKQFIKAFRNGKIRLRG